MIAALHRNGTRRSVALRGWSCSPLLLLSGGIACTPRPVAHAAGNLGVIAGAPPRCDSLPSTADSADYRVIGPIDKTGRQGKTGVSAHLQAEERILPAGRQVVAGGGFVTRKSPPAVFVYARRVLGSRDLIVPIVIGEAPDDLTRPGGLRPGDTSDAVELDHRVLEDWLRADSLDPSATRSGSAPTGAPRLYAALGPNAGPAQTAPAFTVRLPVWQPVTAPIPDPSHHVPPRYPESAQRAGVGATVRLQFVVDEQGIAAPHAIRVIASYLNQTDPPPNPMAPPGSQGGPQVPVAVPVDLSAFAVASERAVKEQRFIPASVAGCAVKAVVETSFLFGMRDR